MSIKLIEEMRSVKSDKTGGKKLSINSFYGGDFYGTMIQLTVGKHFIQLDKDQVYIVQQELTEWLKDYHHVFENTVNIEEISKAEPMEEEEWEEYVTDDDLSEEVKIRGYTVKVKYDLYDDNKLEQADIIDTYNVATKGYSIDAFDLVVANELTGFMSEVSNGAVEFRNIRAVEVILKFEASYYEDV